MRKMTMLLTVLGLSMALLMATTGTAPGQSDTAGKVTLESKSIAVGVGVSWGDGTLEYQAALSSTKNVILDLGVAKVSARGEVKNLKKPEDFNGNYALVGTGAGAGGGAGAALLKNQNGVEMALVATGQGVKLSVAQGGVSVKLKK